MHPTLYFEINLTHSLCKWTEKWFSSIIKDLLNWYGEILAVDGFKMHLQDRAFLLPTRANIHQYQSVQWPYNMRIYLLKHAQSWHNIHSSYHMCNGIHSLNDLRFYSTVCASNILKRAGNNFWETCNHVRYILNSLYHDGTFHITISLLIHTSEQIAPCSFGLKELVYFRENTYIKLEK